MRQSFLLPFGCFVILRLFSLTVIFGPFSLCHPQPLPCHIRACPEYLFYGFLGQVLTLSLPGLFLLLSCSGTFFSFLSSSDKRSVFRGSLDIRVKPEYDGKKNKPDNGRKRRKSCSGLTRASKKHKAEPHDMYIGSSALQRRFMPQPLMRSSWQQLVNPFFCRHILQRDNQLLVQSVTDVEQTA